MNNIELVLANSLYTVDQFNKAQIDVLNEMIASGISADQIAIIAHPLVNELSYSVLFDYLSKGNSITSIEYQNYLNTDTQRTNDIIVNVYLGKLHGLSDEQIELYIQKNVFNIKIARLLVEHSKDQPAEIVNKLINGKFGANSIVGKQAIQDYINGKLSIEKLLAIINCENLTQDDYEYISKTEDKRIIKLISQAYNGRPDTSLVTNTYFIQSVKIDDCTELVNKYFINNRDNNTIIHFDSLNTYNKFIKICKELDLDNFAARDIVFNYYKNNFTYNNKLINLNLDFKLYSVSINSDKSLKLYARKSEYLLDIYFYKHIFSDITTFTSEFPDLDEYLDIYSKTQGFKTYCQAKWIDKTSDDVIELVKNGYSYGLARLLQLYNAEKEKDEINYLSEELLDVTDKQIEEIICMKENKCSDDDIHYFIDNYLDKTAAKPTDFFDNTKEFNFNKYWSIIEYLDLNKKYETFEDIEVLARLKDAKCTNKEIQFVMENVNEFYIGDSPIQKDLINIFMDYGIANIKYAACDNITASEELKKDMITDYNYAKSTFKNKVKCVGYFINDRQLRISEHLVKYIDNFDDDTFLKIIKESIIFTEFCLKMSTITTDFKALKEMYDSLHQNYSIIEEFNQKDEKVTADVVIKFCKDTKIDIPDVIKDQLPEDMDVIVEKSVDYFTNSKNFKPIKYDEETTYIDIVGNKNLKGNHIITFNKEDDSSYEYIFEIKHKDDILTYTAKITTNKDVKEAIKKSIALIENIDEYTVYVEELQSMLDTI